MVQRNPTVVQKSPFLVTENPLSIGQIFLPFDFLMIGKFGQDIVERVDKIRITSKNQRNPSKNKDAVRN